VARCRVAGDHDGDDRGGCEVPAAAIARAAAADEPPLAHAATGFQFTAHLGSITAPGSGYYVESPQEPSAASDGQYVLETGNTWAAWSTDYGQHFTPLDVTKIFPTYASSVGVSSGICCDQVVRYIPSIDRFVWVMQYNVDPNVTSRDALAIAVASPADLAANPITAWSWSSPHGALWFETAKPESTDWLGW
jgi:hypothetical protein